MVSAFRAVNGYGAACAIGALLTALAMPLYGRIDAANIVLLYLLAVVVVTVGWGRGPGVLCACIAVACFDFFFVSPRFSFTVDQPQYLLTFLVMLAVSLVVSHLTHGMRENALEAQARATEATLLHRLAAELGAAVTLEQVGACVNALLREQLPLGATLYVADAPGKVHPAQHDGPPIAAIEQLIANGVFASGQTLHANADLRDDALTLLLPLTAGANCRGVLALYVPTTPASAVPTEALCTAIAALVATTVERIHFLAQAQHSHLEVQSERLRNSILSALSHDLRTPLTVLYGVADSLAQREDLPHDARGLAELLRDQSRHLHVMVDNLLDMARLHSGSAVLRKEWQSPSELLGACVQSTRAWLELTRVRFEFAPALPLVELDAVLFERVMHNLLENAVKYSPPSSPITITAEVEYRSGDWLRVRVRNAGAGFAPEHLADVFERFARAHPDSDTPGVGLGLGVCRAIVQAHGGQIAASNCEGGCEVELRMPLRPAPPVPDEESPCGAARVP